MHALPKPDGRPNSGARIGRTGLTLNRLKNELTIGCFYSVQPNIGSHPNKFPAHGQRIGSAPDGLNPNAPIVLIVVDIATELVDPRRRRACRDKRKRNDNKDMTRRGPTKRICIPKNRIG